MGTRRYFVALAFRDFRDDLRRYPIGAAVGNLFINLRRTHYFCTDPGYKRWLSIVGHVPPEMMDPTANGALRIAVANVECPVRRTPDSDTDRPRTYPTVTVVIPNRNRPALIDTLLQGLLERTSYENMSVVVVDNGSDDPFLPDVYERWKSTGRLTLVPFDRPFNYSAACNAGARASSSELLLFLNNDMDVLDADWLRRLVDYSRIERAGIVGARLMYPSGRVQHAGVAIVGEQRNLHVFRGAPPNAESMMGSAQESREVSAVTGACQLMPRELFERLGGYDEGYTICYSDLAICLAARQMGFRTIYAGDVSLIHLEGTTRSPVTKAEAADRERFIAYLKAIGFDRDPYFHPALCTNRSWPTLSFDANC